MGNESLELLQDLDKSRITGSCTKNIQTKNTPAKILVLSDMHLGCKHTDIKNLKKTIDMCNEDDDMYVILNGDNIECAHRNSIGSGVYEQDSPTDQYMNLIELLEPLIEKGKIISIIRGNHEDRFIKEVGLDICSIISYSYKIPYLGTGGMNKINVNGVIYKIYTEHGSGGSSVVSSKIKKVNDASRHVEGFDVYVWGHLHELMYWSDVVRKQDSHGYMKSIERIMVLAGHYLKYDKSYAKSGNMKPTVLGSPIIKLYPNDKKIEIELIKY